MHMAWQFVLTVLIGYLIGTLSPSYFIGRRRGLDIRKSGSGNAGASNALILMGKFVGVLVALLDIAKTCFATWLINWLFPALPYSGVIVGVSVILGHVFPFYLRFHGGKGLACLGGIILMSDVRVFGIMLASEVVVALVTDYICFVPLTAAIVFPVVWGVMNKSLVGVLILAVGSAVIIFKHRENFRRIRRGTEMHLSYLWKGEKEIDRVKQHMDEK